MGQKLKVLLGMDSYFPHVDGVVNCIHNYCLNMYKDVDLTLMVPDTGVLKKEIPYKTIKCRSIYLPIIKFNYGLPLRDRKFKKEIMSEKYDIVYIHSPFNMAKLALNVAKKQGIPAVATFHSNMRPIFKSIVKSKWVAERMVQHLGRRYNKFDEIFVCSPLVEEQVRSFGCASKISYLPFGTDFKKCENLEEQKEIFNKAYNLNQEELVFIYVGRIQKLKRIDMILESLKIVKNNNIKFKFFVVGKGSELNSLIRYAKKLGFTEEEVIFTGYLDGKLFPALFARADLLLFPSLYDNFGLVKVEASAYQTPGLFIENSCAGYEIVDNHNGFLSKDSVEEFADKIVSVVSDRQKLKQVGEKAGEEVYINWQECTAQMIERLDNIVQEWKKNGNKK